MESTQSSNSRTLNVLETQLEIYKKENCDLKKEILELRRELKSGIYLPPTSGISLPPTTIPLPLPLVASTPTYQVHAPTTRGSRLLLPLSKLFF